MDILKLMATRKRIRAAVASVTSRDPLTGMTDAKVRAADLRKGSATGPVAVQRDGEILIDREYAAAASDHRLEHVVAHELHHAAAMRARDEAAATGGEVPRWAEAAIEGDR